MSTLRAASVSAILALSLAACTSDPAPSEPTPTDTGSTAAEESPDPDRTKELCRISAAELTEITGVEQTIETAERGGGEIACQAPLDARGVEMDWFLSTPPEGPLPSYREEGASLRGSGYEVAPVALGPGSRGWLATGPSTAPSALVAVRVNRQQLYVSARGTITDESLLDDATAYATGVARAFIANGQD